MHLQTNLRLELGTSASLDHDSDGRCAVAAGQPRAGVNGAIPAADANSATCPGNLDGLSFSESQLLAMPLYASQCPPGFESEAITSDYSPDERIAVLDLSVRARHALKVLGIQNMRQLLSLDASTLLAQRNCGQTTLTAIREAVRAYFLKAHGSLAPSSPSPEAFERVVSVLDTRTRRVLNVLKIDQPIKLLQLTRARVMTVRGAGEGTWNQILRAKQRLGASPAVTSDRSTAAMPFSEAALLAMPLFAYCHQPGLSSAEIHHSYHPDESVQRLNLPVRANAALAELRINTIGELLAADPERILSLPNLGHTSLDSIWAEVRFYLMQANGLMRLPRVRTESFDEMIASFFTLVLPDERDRTIVRRRLGLDGGKRPTLKQLGTQLSLTRERVRQLEQNSLALLDNTRALSHLAVFWTAVSEHLAAQGGADDAPTLSESIAARLGWPASPPPKALASLIDLHPDFSASKGGTVLLTNHPCLRCSTPPTILLRLIADEPCEVVFDDIQVHLRECCKTLCPSPHRVPQRFSDAYIAHITQLHKELREVARVRSGSLYALDNWNIRFGQMTDAVEGILRKTGRPMHFREVQSHLSKWRQQPFSSTTIHNTLGRADNALLWDRGTYIHRDLTKDVASLVERAEEWLIQKLRGDVPCVSVASVFSAFQQECLNQGVCSESALYTCLREAGHRMLALPRYPYIYRHREGLTHVPLCVTVGEWLRDSEEPVSYEAMKNLLIRDVGLKEFQFNMLQAQLADVLRTEDGGFVHASVLGIQKNDLLGLLDYARALVRRYGHVSVARVFQEKRVTCHSLGVSGPRMLFSLLQHYAEDEFDLDRYPQIAPASKDRQDQITGVVVEVREYLRVQGRPCSYDELELHFVEQRGYREGTVFNVVYDNDVLRFLPRCLIHRDAIQWTDEKQAIVLAVAKRVFLTAISTGALCARVDTVIEHHEHELPPLGKQLTWGRTLLADLLSRSDGATVLGNAENAYVTQPNPRGIRCLEDLVWHLLDRDYHGATSLHELADVLRKQGVVRRRITPAMLGEQERVAIVNSEIMHRDLM